MADVTTTGNDNVGRDKLQTDVGDNARSSVIGSKNVRQQIDESITNSGQRNDIYIDGGTNDYRYIALDTKITNVHAEMINLFLILENQREATQERHNAIHDELRQEIRKVAKPEERPVVGPPIMQVILAVLMAVVIILMIYGIFKLNAAVDRLTAQDDYLKQRTALDLRQ